MSVFTQKSKLLARRYRYLQLLLLIMGHYLPAQISNVQIENITFPNGQQLIDVRAITQDTTGLLWFHTYPPSALYTYDGTTLEKVPASGPDYQLSDTFAFYARPQDSIFYITQYPGDRLDKSSGELTRFPMISSFSKLGFFRLPGLIGSDSTFYVGAIDGSVYAFRPEEVVKQARLEERFSLALTQYSRYHAGKDSTFVQQDHLAQLDEIRLTHRDRSFTLDFFVPDFRHTRQNRYTYYLEGYDREWSTPSSSNKLQYENLPPGNYTLRIRGGSTEAYFPSSERVIQVTVLQGWYKTGWAIMAYVLLLSGAVLLAYRHQLRRKLEIAETARIREFDALKTSFYTNITHEFRTPLTIGPATFRSSCSPPKQTSSPA